MAPDACAGRVGFVGFDGAVGDCAGELREVEPTSAGGGVVLKCTIREAGVAVERTQPASQVGFALPDITIDEGWTAAVEVDASAPVIPAVAGMKNEAADDGVGHLLGVAHDACLLSGPPHGGAEWRVDCEGLALRVDDRRSIAQIMAPVDFDSVPIRRGVDGRLNGGEITKPIRVDNPVGRQGRRRSAQQAQHDAGLQMGCSNNGGPVLPSRGVWFSLCAESRHFNGASMSWGFHAVSTAMCPDNRLALPRMGAVRE